MPIDSQDDNFPKATAAQHNTKAYLSGFVGMVDRCKCVDYLKREWGPPSPPR